jgi:Legume lectin domain/Chitobiase/beta-hexosaminidase C-terminal domain
MMYQGRTPGVLSTWLALIAMAMLATCKVASASGTGANLVFSYPNFSGSPSVTPTSAVVISGDRVNMTNGISHHGGGLWYKTLQNVQAFTTQFTFQIPGPDGYGMVFVIQNSNNTTNPGYLGLGAGGNSANGLGYGAGGGASQPALGNSVGLVFSVSPFNQASWYVAPPPIGSVGLYVDGGPAIGAAGPLQGYAAEVDLHPFNINLASDDVMQVTVTYDGTILTMVLTDTSTGATTRQSWPVNIPAIVGGNTAYVGFTSDTPITSGRENTLNSWTFWEGYNTRLATPTFSVTPGQYTSTQSVSVSGPAGATIYYTTNGMPPTTASTQYTGTPISVRSSELIQAVAVETGYTDSYLAQGNYQIQATSTPVINFPSGFASTNGLIQPVGYATINSGNIVLTDTKNTFEAAAAWYAAPVNIQTFNTTFALDPTAVGGNGMAFVIQNYPQTTTGTNYNWKLGNGPFGTVVVSGGPWTLSGVSTNLGYAGILNSIGIIFDYSNGSGNLTGLYTNGAVPTGSSIDMTSSGISLHSGHPLTVNLSYNGTTLVETVTDTVTSAHFTHNYTVNIPSIVGGSSAYAGFTASTGYSGANQTVTAWTYSASQTQTQVPAVPASPTNLVVQ